MIDSKILFREIVSPENFYTITIEIPGTPISKQRHRTVRKNRTVHSYDPQSSNKKHVKSIMQNYMHHHKKDLLPKTATYYLKFDFGFPVSRSTSKKKSDLYYGGGYEYLIKSDCDNLIKFYCDAGNSILYHDDKQIVHMAAYKHYTRCPKTIITITALSI